MLWRILSSLRLSRRTNKNKSRNNNSRNQETEFKEICNIAKELGFQGAYIGYSMMKGSWRKKIYEPGQ